MHATKNQSKNLNNFYKHENDMILKRTGARLNEKHHKNKHAHTKIGKQHQTSGSQEVRKATYLKGNLRGGFLGHPTQTPSALGAWQNSKKAWKRQGGAGMGLEKQREEGAWS